MAAPNIVNVANITGLTTFIGNVSSSAFSVIVSNAASSNKVLKINSLLASNTSGSNVNVSVKIFNQAAGAGTSVSIATTVTVPNGSTLAVIGKDTPLYLEENRSIGVLAGTASALDVVCSYEDIS